MKKYMLVSDLAKQFGIDRSSLFRWLKKNGFGDRMFDVRTESTRGSATKAVTPEVVRQIVEERRRQGWEC